MRIVAKWQIDEHEVCVLEGAGSAIEKFEQDLESFGVGIPLTHRAVWVSSNLSDWTWFIAVLDSEGRCQCGFTVEVIRRKALPGFLALRAYRFGAATSDAARKIALQALVNLTKKEPRIVRVHVETFSLNEIVQLRISHHFKELGFQLATNPACYQNTVIINLGHPAQEILASFNSTARRHIRAVNKQSVHVDTIATPRDAHRMSRLVEETMVRTGGELFPINWAHRITFSNRYPNLSRIVGLYRDNCPADEGLLAFAWGCIHGACAQYAIAASTRPPDFHMPLGYALAWDLISWAKAQQASVFDFGGITAGHYNDGHDPFGGISDFKRYFSKQTVHVANEWIYEPHPNLAKLGDKISTVMRRIKSRPGV